MGVARAVDLEELLGATRGRDAAAREFDDGAVVRTEANAPPVPPGRRSAEAKVSPYVHEVRLDALRFEHFGGDVRGQPLADPPEVETSFTRPKPRGLLFGVERDLLPPHRVERVRARRVVRPL